MKLPYKILILDDDERALAAAVEVLRDAGYDVSGASTYAEAKQMLAAETYDLLVTEVRLRGFNGLHLVRQSRVEYPEMGIVFMTAEDNSMLELEIGRYNAKLCRKPLKPAVFLEVVRESLSGVRRQRRWPRKRVIGGFRVTAAGRPAAVVDVSYGGLRLEVPATTPMPPTFDVEVAGIGLHLEVEPVWTQPAEHPNALLIGAALASESTPAARTWRAIVDRLNP